MFANRKFKIVGRGKCEQRRKARRIRSDRRNMIRWEPKKDDRRERHGRRAHDQVWDAVRSMF